MTEEKRTSMGWIWWAASSKSSRIEEVVENTTTEETIEEKGSIKDEDSSNDKATENI
jgi:hypothetical protein